MEASLLGDHVLAAVAEGQRRGAQELVADGGLQAVHRDAVVQLHQVSHGRGRRRSRVRLYAMLNRIKNALNIWNG